MPKKFHARFYATRKQYRYVVWNHPAMNPLLRRIAWRVLLVQQVETWALRLGPAAAAVVSCELVLALTLVTR